VVLSAGFLASPRVWEWWEGEERGRAPVGDGGVGHQDV